MNNHVPYVPGRYVGPILPPAGTEPTPPRRGIATWLKVLLIGGPLLVLLMIIVAVAAAPDSQPAGPQVIASVHSDPATTGATLPAPPAKPAATSAAPVKAAPATISEGTWEVPGEVKPGTYKVTAPGARGEGWACYWARLKDMDGGLESIADNGNLDAGQRGILVVKKSDKFVELNGECVWAAVR